VTDISTSSPPIPPPSQSSTTSSSTLPVTTSPPINSMPSLVEQSSRCKINIAPNANPSYHLRIGSDATDTMIVNGKMKTVTERNVEFYTDYSTHARKNVSNRIVGGTQVDIQKYPWQVSLHDVYGHQCGGSVISESWILTASHCTDASAHASDWTAWFGSGSQDDFKFERNNENVQTSEIHAMIKPYPKWDPDSYARDIMLFKLKKQIQFTDYVMPICIERFDHIAHETQLMVSGFGDTQNREEDSGESFQASPVLNHVDVLRVSQDVCQNWYGSDHMLQADQICAGHEEGLKDSCVGDSGGPLVKSTYDSSNAVYWYQVGIVSFGFECARPKEPGIYCSVGYHADWIHSAALHFDANF